MRESLPERRLLVAACMAAILCVATARVRVQGRAFDLLTASITDIQEAVDAGALSYERLAGLYLNRVEAYDKKGPQLGRSSLLGYAPEGTAQGANDEMSSVDALGCSGVAVLLA